MQNVGGIILRYSNGWGHLIVTVAAIAALTILLSLSKINEATFALIGGPVLTFWFMSGSANRFNPLNPSAPLPSRGTAPPDVTGSPTQPLPTVKP